MKKVLVTLITIGTLMSAPIVASAQQMDPNMPGMQPSAKPAGAQGIGVVKAIDSTKGTITLQHQPITAIGWPAMTMAFKVTSPDLLKAAKVGDTVQFTVEPAGMNSTVSAVKPVSH